MALYDNDLYIVRESSRGDLLADAIAGGILRVDGDATSGNDLDGTCLGGRVPCTVRSGRNLADPTVPLDVLTIPLNNRAFEALLTETPQDFVPWLWQIGETLDPACFFMPGGGDIPYFEKGEPTDTVTFKQLPRLVTDGEVAVVHPIMYFAERLGQGRLCKKAEGAPWSYVEHRAGRGCLLVLVDRDEATGALEIREPVRLYDQLRAYFD